MKGITLAALLTVAMVLGGIGIAGASPGYVTSFSSTYPAATYPNASKIASCTLCHTSPPTRNAYGADFMAAGHNFKTIESKDSDGDGFTNIQEITAGTFPGDATSKPTPAADTTVPTVTAFNIPATASSLTVSITSLAATDNVGVTGYLVTESASAPAATAAGWSASIPAGYTFASAGAKTLYAWAKDAAGNISASRSAGVTITLPPAADTTAPTVTAFSIPATASSLTVSITSLAATDNVGVTGYLVTESASAPAATAAGWSASIPAGYTFASAGAKTLYAWAKDAAGNVSASRSAGVTITLPPAADTTAPTVTAFSLPATASSLTVSITSFAATDNVGVTGYLITESASKPSASASGWSASMPAGYTFASAGAKTLYAWARDAAGNVSASRSAGVTITLSSPGPTAPDMTVWVGTWFNVTVTNAGYYDQNLGLTGRKSKIKGFLNITGWDPEAKVLQARLFGQDSSNGGSWWSMDMPLQYQSGTPQNFVCATQVNTGNVQYAFTARIIGKTTKKGVLKKGTFTTLGGYHIQSSANDSEDAAGWLSIKGKLVQESAVPGDLF